MSRNDYIPTVSTDLPSGQEKRQLLFDFNGSRVEFPYDKSVIHFIRDQALNNPGKIAVGCDSSQLTFGRLDERSRQLARYLRNQGIREDQTVGILMDRSLQMMESILAVWKAGGAYIPIETDYPLERILEILKDSKSAVLLRGNEYVDPALETIDNIKIINPDLPDPDGETFPLEISMSSLAYVIYTSGSTGKPKGAMVEHLGMMNHMWAKIRDLQLTTRSIVVQDASHTFDISVWQFFAALTVGGKTAIYPHELIIEPEKFLDQLVKHRVTILEVVPSYLSVILAALDTGQTLHLSLDYLVVTGEEVKPHLVKRWFAHYPHIKVVNAYGPTEASDDITHYIMDKAPELERIPIGKPLQNFDIFIVDENMNLCPVGVKGEIRVSGIGVGRGYLNNPELTAEKFCLRRPGGTLFEKTAPPGPPRKNFLLFNLPITPLPHSPIYLTGDLGCRLPDGTIDFFGRKDHQVKIRGFRIELGEIENRLLNDKRIKNAVVIDREDAQGHKYLCAYLVTAGEKLEIPTVKTRLSGQLPDYMVPTHFVEMEKIPLTTNGKIDRKSLPAPGTGKKQVMTYITTEMMKADDRETRNYTPDRNLLQEPMIKEFPLSPGEREQILFTFNATKAEYPGDKTVHGLFAEQVQKTPGNAAVIFNQQEVTYQELEEKANGLARQLVGLGVGRNTVVGIMTFRAVEMMIGLLAILKAGGAYLSIDPDYPQERSEYMLNDSCTGILLTNIVDRAHGLSPVIIDLNTRGNSPGDSLDLNSPRSTAHDLFAVLYTSGTTGTPKGVLLEHRGIINRLNWMQKAYPLDQKDVLLQKTPYVFDVSIWELFWWGFHGASLCILNPGEEVNPGAVIEAIDNTGVTTIHYVPSMLTPFLEELKNPDNRSKVASLRQVFASGEVLTVYHITRFNDLLNKVYGTKLINLYGPTEASVDVSYFDCSAKEALQKVPIGKPIDNISLYILNKNNQLQPKGKIGELGISGIGLARGYINKPGLTADTFISSPFHKGKRIYKTGDLALWLPDGNIEFIGRKDQQVKFKGIRIELGEIESCLLKYDNIKEAVAVVREDEQGDKYLMAYLVSPGPLIESDLRNYLAKELPRYLEPAFMVQLEKIPLMPNGKVNRKLLETVKIIKAAHETPHDEIEKELAKIWAEVLGIEETAVGKGADFFQLGGDSISALQVAIKARQAGIELTSHQVFQHPGIEELAAAVKSKGAKESPAQPASHFTLLPMEKKELEELTARHPGLHDVYPLTPIQQQMLFYTLLAPGPDVAIMHLSWVITGELEIPAFTRAWQTAAIHHDILRTAFKNRRLKEPVQLLFETVTIPIQQLDCTGMSAEQQRQAIEEYELNDKKQGFKIARAPLMRLCLVILPGRQYRFICSYSALLLDNWSANLIVNDVFRYYDSYVNNKAAQPPAETPRPFADYVRWLLNHDPAPARDFWQQELEDFNAPVTPIDQEPGRTAPRPGYTPGEREIRLLSRQVTTLSSLASQYHLTPGTILQGAWVIALSRFTGQEDILSAVLSYGRPEQVIGIDAMAGLFINTVPVRTKVPAAGELITWLREFQEKQVRLRRFDYVSIEDIAGGNRALLAKIQTAIYERTFVLVKPQGQEFLSGLARENPIKINDYDDSLIMNVPLRVYAELPGEDIIIRLRYNRAALPAHIIEKLAQCLENLLQQIIKQPGIRLENL